MSADGHYGTNDTTLNRFRSDQCRFLHKRLPGPIEVSVKIPTQSRWTSWYDLCGVCAFRIWNKLNATGTARKQQYNCCCSWTTVGAPSPLPFEREFRCPLPLQNHLLSHSTGWCKSSRCHWTKTGMTPLPAWPDLIPSWAVPTFPCPPSSARSAASLHLYVADTPQLCH